MVDGEGMYVSCGYWTYVVVLYWRCEYLEDSLLVCCFGLLGVAWG